MVMARGGAEGSAKSARRETRREGETVDEIEIILHDKNAAKKGAKVSRREA
jgi:hypothetical protein